MFPQKLHGIRKKPLIIKVVELKEFPKIAPSSEPFDSYEMTTSSAHNNNIVYERGTTLNEIMKKIFKKDTYSTTMPPIRKAYRRMPCLEEIVEGRNISTNGHNGHMQYKSVMTREHIFDSWNPTSAYLTGIFIDAYSSNGISGKFTIRSSNKEIVHFVKKALGIENTIVADPQGKSSYSLTVINHHIANIMEEMGIGTDIGVALPRQSQKYMRSIIRGMIESENSITYGDQSIHIRLTRRQQVAQQMGTFLYDLKLVEKVSEPTPHGIRYLHNDSVSILRYIYEGTPSIYSRTFFRKSQSFMKRRRHFVINSERASFNRKSRREEIVLAIKQYLLKGKKVIDFYKNIGFSTYGNVWSFFRRHEGITIREYMEHRGLR
jgi:hypothetical protein